MRRTYITKSNATQAYCQKRPHILACAQLTYTEHVVVFPALLQGSDRDQIIYHTLVHMCVDKALVSQHAASTLWT